MKNIYNKEFSKEFSKPSIANEKVNSPQFFKVLGDIKGKKILDLGCGNGYWLKKFVDKGAICVGIDNSAEQLKIAEKLNLDKKVSFLNKDITKPLKLNSKFDIALLIKVILEEKSKVKIQKMIKNAHGALKKGGRLIILDLHPFAPNFQHTITPPKNYNYFQSGVTVRAMSTKVNNEKIFYNDKHWTFEDFSSFLYNNDFHIKRLIEHRASIKLLKKYPTLENRVNNPMDIIIEAVKY
ncbi:class I SAM-dependent methyltransferase [Patescibacteria group bacterium]|nr:class I SAM-dependent methyltransferase [Patescibacteria group bacterium]